MIAVTIGTTVAGTCSTVAGTVRRMITILCMSGITLAVVDTVAVAICTGSSRTSTVNITYFIEVA
jgi:hypothetical protein